MMANSAEKDLWRSHTNVTFHIFASSKSLLNPLAFDRELPELQNKGLHSFLHANDIQCSPNVTPCHLFSPQERVTPTSKYSNSQTI